MASKSTVKQWFLTGLKPTQNQFHSFFDSIWFKEEKIPVDKIDGLQEILEDKADSETVTNLFDTVRIIPVGQMLVFKVEPNEDNSKKETGDFCIGMVENEFINANYLGGDENSASSYGDSNG